MCPPSHFTGTTQHRLPFSSHRHHAHHAPLLSHDVLLSSHRCDAQRVPSHSTGAMRHCSHWDDMKCNPPLISRPTMPPSHPTGVTPTASPLISQVQCNIMLPLSCHWHNVKYATLSSHGRDATLFSLSYPIGVNWVLYWDCHR